MFWFVVLEGEGGNEGMFEHSEAPPMSLLWAATRISACGLGPCSHLGKSPFCLRSEENAPGFAAEGEGFVLKSLIKISPTWFPFPTK